jgi:glucose repression regulatory protein TUP1
MIVSGSGDKSARAWEVESGKELYTLQIEDPTTSGENGPADAGVTSVTFSQDSKLLAAGSLDTIVRVWDARTGRILEKFKGHKDSVYSVAFDPAGKWLSSGSLDKTLRLWDLAPAMASLASGHEGGSSAEESAADVKANCILTMTGHKVSSHMACSVRSRRSRMILPCVSRTTCSLWLSLLTEIGLSRDRKIAASNSGTPRRVPHS